MHTIRQCFASPLGTLIAYVTEYGVFSLNFQEDQKKFKGTAMEDGEGSKPWVKDKSSISRHLKQLDLWLKYYFSQDWSKLKTINLAFDLQGTPFFMQAWKAIAKIPVGQTKTYGEIARRIKNPKASRAVGSAMNANPIALIIPCHRIIGSNGKLTGYAAGLERKRWLLNHEK